MRSRRSGKACRVVTCERPASFRPMKNPPTPLDLQRVKVFPLAQRKTLTTIQEILVDPDQPAPPCPTETLAILSDCVEQIRAARERDASVILMFGAR